MSNNRITRRDLFQYSAMLAAFSVTAPIRAAVLPKVRGGINFKNTVFYVPGYRPQRARCQGIPLSSHSNFTAGIADDYQGPKTMVSRFEWGGKIHRKVFPLKGHQITVSKQFPLAFFNSIDHPTMVSFDRESLELDRIIKPHSKQFVGGGHALFTDDNCCLINLERRDMRPFQGKIEDHYGAIVIRDPLTMKVMTAFSCYGINPHEIRRVDDHTVAVSNYGSTGWPLDHQQRAYPYVIEPSITVIDIHNGKLLEKYVAPDKQMEVRHLAVDSRGGLLAIQTRLVEAKDENHYSSEGPQIFEADDTVDYRLWFAPAPLLSISNRTTGVVKLSNPMDQRQGQSMLYDPQYDEFIITYTSSHRIAVVDAQNSVVKRVIKTDQLGIQYPRGIQLLPNNTHYAISGSWRNIRLFSRGSHLPVETKDGNRYETFYGHSHMSVI
jgi:hypothetical protein